MQACRSLAAEQALLSAVIQQTIRPSETGLSPDQFERAEHRRIFRAAMEMEQRRQEIDLVTLSEATGLEDTLIGILAGGSGFSIDLALRHAQIVRSSALRRAAAQVLADASGALAQPEAEPAGVCLTACDRLRGLIEGSSAARTRSMYELVMDEMEAWAQPEAKAQRVTTGLDRLDAMLGGGMLKSNLVVVGARPGAGKSALLLSMALAAAAAGKKALYISLEMSGAENAQRTLAHIAQIACSRLLRHEPLSDRENERISDGLMLYNLENLRHYAASVCRVSDIRSMAVRMRAKEGLDAVFVDYIGLVRPEQSLGNRVSEISQITRDLKALAMELDVVVAAAAQLNRDSVRLSRRPVLSDLRESGSIEQDANVVIFVHDGDQSADEYGARRMELILAKNRQGQRGIIRTVFRGNVMRFVEET